MGSGEVERDQWGGKLDFILSCLGYAVGLGNVWRFPYLCGRSGGAAFMIPYLIMMIFAGLPTFYMELAIGQFCSLTPALLYERMCPIFAGIGFTMVAISAYTAIYYNMIIAWSLRYLVASFTSYLPWTDCTNEWNTVNCYDFKLAKECSEANTTYFAGYCHDWTDGSVNATLATDILATTNRTPAKEYLDFRILHKSSGIHDIGTPQWELVVALAVAWVMIFCCLIKGIKSSGKVVYFTATFPYLILLILFFRGITLEGAMDGVKFYMVPTWSKLSKGSVWGDAAVQIFFSLSLGGGGLTTLASFNKFHNNLARDTLIVVFGNCLTSFFAGFVIFPILGFIALRTGRQVEDVAAEGVGLAFVAYADAVTQLPPPPLWAILFFFMLVLLGIDSQMVICDVVITAVLDVFPDFRHGIRKTMVVLGISVVGFIIGLCLTCPGGPYVLDLLDKYAGGWPLVLACLVEIIMVAWFYGVGRFIGDICLMLGIRYRKNSWFTICHAYMNPYWWLNWVAISPALLTFVLIFNWATYKRTEYEDKSLWPIWAEVLGWFITVSCIMWIPIMAVYKVVKYSMEGRPMMDLIRPTTEWGPGDPDVAAEIMRKGEVASVIYHGNKEGSGPGSYDNAGVNVGYPIPIGGATNGGSAGYSKGNDNNFGEYGGIQQQRSENGSRPPSYMNAVGDVNRGYAR